ncbi:MAG: hypothetical protein HY791_05085 [Deltaproteobacteria bacterium]|nr:hypothetical protein [Deltaproteobacteria bacterium]
MGTILAACSSDPGTTDEPSGPNTTPPDPIEKPQTCQTPPCGSGPDSTTHPPQKSAPSVSHASVRISGRDGHDLSLRARLLDADADLSLLELRFFDELGQPLDIFDTDLDGFADSGVQTILIQGGDQEWAHLLADFVSRWPAVGRVDIVAKDASGLASSSVVAPVLDQPNRDLGQSCDPSYTEDRCLDGLGCRGTPSKCVEGTAPRIARFAYLSTPVGPRILIEGEDLDDDPAYVELEFMNARGEAVEVDLDNDESPDSSSFRIDAMSSSRQGEFFVELRPASTLAEQVVKLAATAVDSRGATGARAVATLSDPTHRTWGQACSTRGFDVCPAAGICSPAGSSANFTCQAAASRRTAVCNQSPVLELSGAPSTVSGHTHLESLWDATPGCAPQDPVGMPEGIVRLRVASESRVRLTTDLPETSFDTILYVLPGCAADGTEAIACSDDAPGTSASSLELTLAPGEYLVVVDAWSGAGGAFALEARTE